MNSLVRMGQGRNELANVSLSLAEHLSRMDVGAETAKYGMDVISDLYIKAEHNTLVALGITEQMRNAGTPIKLTAEQNAAFQSLRQRYIERIGFTAEAASNRIIEQILNAPSEAQSTIDRLLGLLSE